MRNLFAFVCVKIQFKENIYYVRSEISIVGIDNLSKNFNHLVAVTLKSYPPTQFLLANEKVLEPKTSVRQAKLVFKNRQKTSFNVSIIVIS